MIVHHILCVLAAIFGTTVSLSRLPESNAEVYTFCSTVSVNELDATPQIKDVGYRVAGQIHVARLWSNPNDPLDKVYHVRISALKLWLKEIQNDIIEYTEQEDGFKTLKNEPFFVHWNNYRVEHIYLNNDEPTSIKNLKKALASLFQFRDTHIDIEEMDVCGLCTATYEVIDKFAILKRKKNCISHLPVTENPEKILSAERDINREVFYQLDKSSKVLKILSNENLNLSLSIRKNVGVSVTAHMELNYNGTESENIRPVSSDSAADAVQRIADKLKMKFTPDALYITEESFGSDEKSLHKTLKENREYLKASNLGTHKSAASFLEVLNVISHSSEEDIIKALKNKKNEPILNQLMDILGTAQTTAAHNAVLKIFNFVEPKIIDPLERYLWSMSLSKKPKVECIEDLKNILKQNPKNEKLKETIILTLTAVARKLSAEVLLDVYSFVQEDLKKCPKDDEYCIATHIRAFKNLKHPEAKSTLLKYAENGSRLLSVTALKALYAFPASFWDTEILKVVENIYYQRQKIYDSTARAIAIDIIIDSKPNLSTLRYLMKSLKTNTSYETRKYLLQRLQQTASMNETFNTHFQELMIQENLNHYGFLAQRGLSNALSKNIYSDSYLNASLFTINEVSKSVLKRCHVSVSLEQEDEEMKICGLDLFTGGLSSFLWSDEIPGEEELEEPEDLIAGVELTVYGVSIRPFIFFNGHAQLMGHIWAGTATERTPIQQAVGLLHEHRENIALGTGNVIRFDLRGGSSFELAGKIDFSIWNRNAHTNLDSKIGVVIDGSAHINAFFVQNRIDFDIHSEQKVDVIADLDFYDEVLFCLQISQMKTEAKTQWWEDVRSLRRSLILLLSYPQPQYVTIQIFNNFFLTTLLPLLSTNDVDFPNESINYINKIQISMRWNGFSIQTIKKFKTTNKNILRHLIFVQIHGL